jgi:hypothetical protein
MSWKSNRIAELEGHRVSIGVACGCTRVLTRPPSYFTDRFGPDATFEDSERGMVCRVCDQHAVLTISPDWGVSGGRDRRVNPPPMPSWVNL